MYLHIVTLDIPFPPDYGGMIDTFYRIKWLSRAGVSINLHCFEYGRKRARQLSELCHTVNYYPREIGIMKLLSSDPFIVAGRNSRELLKNLSADDNPILFDGLHTTLYAEHQSLKSRMKLVRTHNIEHDYYSGLARFESNPLKKLYFKREARKLISYEKILKTADYILPISIRDNEYFTRYGNSVFLPAFHPFAGVESRKGKGDYIFFHGDLSVNENAFIAGWLISEVFSHVSARCIIAGRKPAASLKRKVSAHKNITLVADPSQDEMHRLLAEAQINILPSFSSNGFRMKILSALFLGRHCLVNSVAATNSMVPPLFALAESATDFAMKIEELMVQPFTDEHITERKRLLGGLFDNLKNAEIIMQLIQNK